MTTSCWKFWTFCFNLNRTCDRRAHAGDLQNDPPIKTFPWFSFLSTHNKKLTIHRRTWFFILLFSFFPLSFCIKAWQVPGWTAFSGPTYVNPSGPTHFSFHCIFYGIVCKGLYDMLNEMNFSFVAGTQTSSSSSPAGHTGFAENANWPLSSTNRQRKFQSAQDTGGFAKVA